MTHIEELNKTYKNNQGEEEEEEALDCRGSTLALLLSSTITKGIYK